MDDGIWIARQKAYENPRWSAVPVLKQTPLRLYYGPKAYQFEKIGARTVHGPLTEDQAKAIAEELNECERQIDSIMDEASARCKPIRQATTERVAAIKASAKVAA